MTNHANNHAIGRRSFLTAAAAAAAAGAFDGTVSHAQQAVPNTTGTDPAKVKAPGNAADCHMHIYDPRFAESNPRPGQNPKNATVSDYRLLQKRTGTTRVVVVTPRSMRIHGTLARALSEWVWQSTTYYDLWGVLQSLDSFPVN